MQEYRLGICDYDTGYMLGLMDYMNMCEDIPFHVSAFTSLQDMGREVENGNVDILLVDSSMEVKYENLPVVGLDENGEDLNGQEYIFKYQSMESISEKLCRITKKRLKTAVSAGGGFYGVYSPVGRCGVSRCALRLAGESENSLLVMLENFRERTCSEDDSFMYYLLSHNEAVGNIIGAMQGVGERGIKVVPGPLSYQDIRELKRSDIDWFRELVSSSGCCEQVVFDIGSGALGSFDVLLAFDTVYVPCTAGGKLESFKKAIGYGTGSGYERILKFVDAEE